MRWHGRKPRLGWMSQHERSRVGRTCWKDQEEGTTLALKWQAYETPQADVSAEDLSAKFKSGSIGRGAEVTCNSS